MLNALIAFILDMVKESSLNVRISLFY